MLVVAHQVTETASSTLGRLTFIAAAVIELGRARRRAEGPRSGASGPLWAALAHRQALRRRGIIPRIARRGVESREHLGRHRWVVERTISWLNRYRRLRVRYERRDDIHQAFLSLGCALICWNTVQRTEFC